MSEKKQRLGIFPSCRGKSVAPYSPVNIICLVLIIFGSLGEVYTEKARVAIYPAGHVASKLPFSPAIKIGDQVFVSGQLGIDPVTSQVVEGGVAEETKAIFVAIEQILTAAGASFKHICKVTVLMQDLDEFSVMNQVYEQEMKKRFGDEPLPARTTSQAALVIRNARIEIDAIAVIQS